MLLLTLLRICICAVKGQGDGIRYSFTLRGVEAKSECYSLDLVCCFILLMEVYRLIHLSDTALFANNIHINIRHIGFLLYIDMEYWHSYLLRHTSTMYKASAGTLLTDTIDALAYLDVNTSLYTHIFTLPCLCSVTIPKTCTNDKTTILYEASATLCLEIGEIRFVKCLVLIDIAMVSSNKDVVSIGITDSLDDTNNLIHFVLCSLKHLSFGCQRITHLVNGIAIDIHKIVVLHPVLVALGQELFCFDSRTLRYCCLQYLRTVSRSLCADTICKYFCRFLLIREYTMWQECCHTKLGIRWLNAEHCMFHGGFHAVLLCYALFQFLHGLIAKCIADDDKQSFSLLCKRRNMNAEEGALCAYTCYLPFIHGIHYRLPLVS